MGDLLSLVDHRPWPLPPGRWTMSQRWNDLLFAHWPLPVAALRSLVPESLEIDTFDRSAWISVVPFHMDRIEMRGVGRIPGHSRFAELNLRTYVRDCETGMPGIYFFSLDAASSAAVVAARLWFHLPYFWANMNVKISPGSGSQGNSIQYRSERLLSRRTARFRANYRSLGPNQRLAQSTPGSIEYFLTERYCLYTTTSRGQLLRGNIHHAPWPLENAEAEWIVNELPDAHGIQLPDTPPLLYYARELAVYVWSLENVGARRTAAIPAPAQV